MASRSSSASRFARPVSPSRWRPLLQQVLQPLGPQGDADPGLELDRVERLGHVVDRAEVEAPDDLGRPPWSPRRRSPGSPLVRRRP